MSWARVVLPVPGGPQRITDDSRSASISARSGWPGPSSWSWPTISSSVAGRSRAASGAWRARRSDGGSGEQVARRRAGHGLRLPAGRARPGGRLTRRVSAGSPSHPWKCNDDAMIAVGLAGRGSVLVWVIVFGGLGLFIWRRLQGIPLRDKPKVGDDPIRAALPPLEPPTASAMPVSPAAGACPRSDRGGPPAGGPPPSLPGPWPGPRPLCRSRRRRRPPPLPPPGAASSRRGRPTRRHADGSAPLADRRTGHGGRGRPGHRDALWAHPGGRRVQLVAQPVPGELPRPPGSGPGGGPGSGRRARAARFHLDHAATTELLARRDRTELRVVLYPTAASAQRGLDQLFPAAGPGAVGVELST